MARFVSIWFRYLSTDWFTMTQSGKGEDNASLNQVPFVLRAPSHGRMVITAANACANRLGIHRGMVLADARALFPDLQVMDDKPDLIEPLLDQLAEWCIRFTPVVAVDAPDGLLLDASGCAHLWGGEEAYLSSIGQKLKARGYDVCMAMADTVGLAWGAARFGNKTIHIISSERHVETLLSLPPEALRIESETTARLHKLGLHQIRSFINIPPASLRRRFGLPFMSQLNKALGLEKEVLNPVRPMEPYQERLACLEPIVTATGIEIALRELLTTLCLRLQKEQKGLRVAIFKGYRVDGKVEQVEIGTHQPSHHVAHVFKLFEIKLGSIEPALGIELFTLEATKVEDHLSKQDRMWEESSGLGDERISELVDRLAIRIGSQAIQRFVPAERYWPERSYQPASNFSEKSVLVWPTSQPRPLELFAEPIRIDVTAPIPDYPPLLFRYLGKVHTLVKADGPERIEQEWWIQRGQHRDYYYVEDDEGYRFWIFRLGHYHDESYQWYLHGVFA